MARSPRIAWAASATCLNEICFSPGAISWATSSSRWSCAARRRSRPDAGPSICCRCSGCEGFEQAWPAALSGGMRQRAALLRTILTDSRTLLLDEPFGALDALTRREMQDWLLDLWTRLQPTVLFITHDVDEAVYLADRVLVLGPRPARIVRELKVRLPRPRHQGMVALPIFGEHVATLLQALGVARASPRGPPKVPVPGNLRWETRRRESTRRRSDGSQAEPIRRREMALACRRPPGHGHVDAGRGALQCRRRRLLRP